MVEPMDQEDGAVAIVVAIVLSVLLIFAAFAIDFGLAYTNRQQLQTAADAAVLGAAAVYDGEPGDCATLQGDDGLRDVAHGVASSLMRDNHATATGPERATWRPACDGAGGARLVVRWRADDPVDTSLGGIIGLDQIQTNADAAAGLLSAATSVSNLRPYGVCSSEVPAVLPSAALRVNFEGHTSGGACDGLPGNWRQLDCPNDSPSKLDDATELGCDDPVDVVPDQPPPGDPTLPGHLLAACPPNKGDSDSDCLSADPGNNFTDAKVISAWDGLLGQRISLPVVCGTPACNPAATRFPGNNGQYPIHRIVDVTVCGYHWQKNKKADISTGECAGSLDVDGDKTQDQYLVLKFHDASPVGGGGGSSSSDVGLVE